MFINTLQILEKHTKLPFLHNLNLLSFKMMRVYDIILLHQKQKNINDYRLSTGKLFLFFADWRKIL